MLDCSVCGGGYPCFEISAVNADKPSLPVAEIKRRVEQFRARGRHDLHLQTIHVFKIFFPNKWKGQSIFPNQVYVYLLVTFFDIGLSIGLAGKTVIVSNQPYFYKKAQLFPGSSFVIGADTAARLVNVCFSFSLNYTVIFVCYTHTLSEVLCYLLNSTLLNKQSMLTDLNLLMQTKYYEGSHKKMLEILGDCKRTGCDFLVGGRVVDGVFKV